MIWNFIYKVTPIENKTFAAIAFFVLLFIVIYASNRLLRIFLVRAKFDKLYDAAIKGVQHFVDAKHFKKALLKNYMEQFRSDIEMFEALTINSNYYNFIEEDFFSFKRKVNDFIKAILETLSLIKLTFTYSNEYSSIDVIKTSILLI